MSAMRTPDRWFIGNVGIEKKIEATSSMPYQTTVRYAR